MMSIYKNLNVKIFIHYLLYVRVCTILEMIPQEHKKNNIGSMKESLCQGLFRTISDVQYYALLYWMALA